MRAGAGWERGGAKTIGDGAGRKPKNGLPQTVGIDVIFTLCSTSSTAITAGVPDSKAVVCKEQYDRLIEGTRLIRSRLRVENPSRAKRF